MIKKWIHFLGWSFLLLMTSWLALLFSIAPIFAFQYHDIWIDFSQHEVNNFDDVPIVLNKNTFGATVYGWSSVAFRADFSSCPAPQKEFALRTILRDATYNILHDSNQRYFIPCQQTGDFIVYERYFVLDELTQQTLKDAIIEDNNESIRLYTLFSDNYDYSTFPGVTIELKQFEIMTVLYYEFNTTYYFDHLATDVHVTYPGGFNITVNHDDFESDARTYLLAAYDSNNFYRIRNSDFTMNSKRGRIKYHVPLGQVATAYGIGIGTYAVLPFNSASYEKASTGVTSIAFESRLYLLNYSNTQQSFPGASTTAPWAYASCSVWDIPCHLGNALVYLALDAPITSDIMTILHNGYQIVSNGLFAVTSVFGAVFNSGGFVGGSAFGVLLVISLGLMIVVTTFGGDNDE